MPKNKLQPDADMIEAHLEHHFNDTLHGTIEISGIKPNGPIFAKQFEMDDPEGATAQAVAWNSQGMNVYFGVAPRGDGLTEEALAKSRQPRGSDIDCLPTSCRYVVTRGTFPLTSHDWDEGDVHDQGSARDTAQVTHIKTC